MKRKRLSRFSKILLVAFLLTTYDLLLTTLYADTIRMNDGKEVKGIVVEDYKDRLIISTADGEMTLMKSDIRELYFDAEVDNLIKLAEQAKDRRDYTRAFAYYDMAFRRDPNSKSAKDGLIFLQGYLFRQEQAKKESEVKKQEDLERYGSAQIVEKTAEEELAEMASGIKKGLGITLAIKESLPEVVSVLSPSPAYDAGIRTGDFIISIWGRLTGYLSLKEVMAVLLEKPSLEIKCEIERMVEIEVNPMRLFESSPEGLIGASFSMELDGLTVSGIKAGGYASVAGLAKGDIITAIDAKSTRYMPLKKAVDTIKNIRAKSVKITFKREVLIWRKN